MSLHNWRIVFVPGLFLSLFFHFSSFLEISQSSIYCVCCDKMANRRNQIQNTQYLILISLTDWNYDGVIFLFISLCIVQCPVFNTQYPIMVNVVSFKTMQPVISLATYFIITLGHFTLLNNSSIQFSCERD